MEFLAFLNVFFMMASMGCLVALLIILIINILDGGFKSIIKLFDLNSTIFSVVSALIFCFTMNVKVVGWIPEYNKGVITGTVKWVKLNTNRSIYTISINVTPKDSYTLWTKDTALVDSLKLNNEYTFKYSEYLIKPLLQPSTKIDSIILKGN